MPRKILTKAELKKFYNDNKKAMDQHISMHCTLDVGKFISYYGLTPSETPTPTFPNLEALLTKRDYATRRRPLVCGMAFEHMLYPERTLDELLSFSTEADVQVKAKTGEILQYVLTESPEKFNRIFHNGVKAIINMLKEEARKIDGYGPQLKEFTQKYGALLEGLWDAYGQRFMKKGSHEGIPDNELNPVYYDITAVSMPIIQLQQNSEGFKTITDGIKKGRDILLNSSEDIASLFSRRAIVDHGLNKLQGRLNATDADKTEQAAQEDATLLPNVRASFAAVGSEFRGLLDCLDEDEFLTLFSASQSDMSMTIEEIGPLNYKFLVEGIDLQIGTPADKVNTEKLAELKSIIAWHRNIQKTGHSITDSQKQAMDKSRIKGTPSAREKKYSADKVLTLADKGIDNKYEPKGPVVTEDGSIILNHLHQDRAQSSANGCWSVSLGILMQSRGVTLEQEQIRAYIPGMPGTTLDDFSDYDRNLLTQDIGNSPSDRADIVLKTLPNTAVVSKKISVEANTPQQINDACNIIKNTVMQALTEDKSPISLLFGGHVRTIVGINEDKLILKDSIPVEGQNPFPDKNSEISIADLIADSENNSFDLTWLRDIKPGHDLNTGDFDNKFPGVKYQNGSLLNTGDNDTETIPFHKEGTCFCKVAISGVDLPEGIGIAEEIYMPNRIVQQPEHMKKIEDEIIDFNPRYEKLTQTDPKPPVKPPEPNFWDNFKHFFSGSNPKVLAWNKYKNEIKEYRHPLTAKINSAKDKRLDISAKVQQIRTDRQAKINAQNRIQDELKLSENSAYLKKATGLVSKSPKLADFTNDALASMARLRSWAKTGQLTEDCDFTKDMAKMTVLNYAIIQPSIVKDSRSALQTAEQLAARPEFVELIKKQTEDGLKKEILGNCVSFTSQVKKEVFAKPKTTVSKQASNINVITKDSVGKVK